MKAAIDPSNALSWWTRVAGTNGGYCKWSGVLCADGKFGKTTVTSIYTALMDTLQGTLPPAAAFSGLDGLTSIDFHHQSWFSGTLPADWSNLKQLQVIQLWRIQLTGTIPPSWGSLVNLKVLNVKWNMLVGHIPDSFKAPASLEELDLAGSGGKGAGGSALTGTVPSWLGDLKHLRRLTLHTNAFKGTMPAALGRLSKLQTLSVSDNDLTGTLPDAWKALTGLEELHLRLNRFGGTVPASWSAMHELKEGSLVSLWSNLEGCLPASWKRVSHWRLTPKSKDSADSNCETTVLVAAVRFTDAVPAARAQLHGIAVNAWLQSIICRRWQAAFVARAIPASNCSC